jgi:hypothetical protein
VAKRKADATMERHASRMDGDLKNKPQLRYRREA